jgi:hypothetical protein
MTPTITAFERSPDRGKGLARDMRVRWALEEVGQPYEVRLVSGTSSACLSSRIASVTGAYVARGEARAAFRRAFDAQFAVLTGKPRTG